MGQSCSSVDKQGGLEKAPPPRRASMINSSSAFAVPGLNKTTFEEEYKGGAVVGDKVQVALNKITQRLDVVYKLSKATCPIGDGERLAQVIKRIQSIEHPNVCRLIEAFDSGSTVCLVYAKVEGKLLVKSLETDGLSERRVAEIGFQIVRALSAGLIDQPPVIHGALAPKNIIVTTHGPVMLTDLGLMDTLKPDPIAKLQKDTFVYLAPEVVRPWINKQENTDPSGKRLVDLARAQMHEKTSACDVWSLGVIMYQLIAGKLPFDGPSLLEIGKKIIQGQLNFDEDLGKVSKQARDVVQKCLQPVSSKRPSVDQLLADKWLASSHTDKICDRKFSKSVITNLVTVHAESSFKKMMMTMISEKIPPSKIQELHHAFDAVDKNHDGMITLKELKDYIMKHPEFMKADDLEEAWKTLDNDGSGHISIHEFIAATLDSQGVLVHDVLRKTFTALDANRSGTLTKDELRRGIAEVGGRLPSEHLEDILRIVENEVSGEMTFEQFCALMQEEGAGAARRQSAGCCSPQSIMASCQRDAIRA